MESRRVVHRRLVSIGERLIQGSMSFVFRAIRLPCSDCRHCIVVMAHKCFRGTGIPITALDGTRREWAIRSTPDSQIRTIRVDRAEKH
jgi:hypothetical protein